VGDAAEDLPDRFVSDYATSAEQAAAADLVCESVVANGAVLLLNRGDALPLAGSEKVSLFGTSSARFVYGGTGSGGMDNSKAILLKDALEQDGFSVNPTLWAFYREGAGSKYGLQDAGGSLNNYIFKNEEFAVNEAPLSAFSAAEWDSVSQYGDAAIMVIGRVCGEGKDLPVVGASDAGGNMLSISAEEKDILRKLAELKAAGSLKKIVLLLNTANAVEALTGAKFSEQLDEEGGFLEFHLMDLDNHDAQLLLKALELGLRQISESYPENLMILEDGD
jgi:beta-glucosidase